MWALVVMIVFLRSGHVEYYTSKMRFGHESECQVVIAKSLKGVGLLAGRVFKGKKTELTLWCKMVEKEA